MGMERISSLIVFVIGLLITWQASKLRLGGFHKPGPGLFPLILGLILILLSLILLIQSKGRPGSRSFSFGESPKRIVMVYGSLLAYVAILEYAGFLLSSFLLIFFLFVVLGEYTVKRAALTALAATAVAYVLFDVLLKSPLPKSLIGVI
jgi:putative tricarboxylic transport membrane protein